MREIKVLGQIWSYTKEDDGKWFEDGREITEDNKINVLESYLDCFDDDEEIIIDIARNDEDMMVLKA